MFNGPISSIHWENLINLERLELHNNQLVGSIPSSLFSLPLLPVLHLSHNNFTGRVPEIFNVSNSLVTSIDLSFNNLEGPVPVSIFNLRGLQTLILSSNNFSAFPFNGPHQLPNLAEIDLSHNSLLVLYNGSNSSYSSFPQIMYFNLASNKLRTFPVFLRNQTNLTELDLSENQIQGQLPNWIWKLDSLVYLNVSYNALESLEAPFLNSTSPVSMIDLHSNQLKGPISIVPPNVGYLDYSDNHFSSSIPISICNASDLGTLDLSNNSLSGEIPQCLAAMSTLSILNVRKNNIAGTISNLEFPENCTLQSLDLSQNQIKGQLPKSLARCSSLSFLNLEENQITDTFPCLLKNISYLSVLALRSNNFYGGIGCPVVKTNGTWPILQIIDLAYNNFNGEVPGFFLTSWQAMKDNKDIGFPSTVSVFQGEDLHGGGGEVFHENAITIISKGLKSDLAKILTILTLIDFSCNNFSGPIPKEMGDLKSLYALNLSSNAFTGEIPSSFGNMQQLESLDLSQNKLSGQIPQQLVKLHFLAFLNLSNNQLVGKIPAGTQISTFPRDSFTGNKGLWGPPLTVDNKAGQSPSPTLNGSHPNSRDEIDWDLISVEIGFVFGFAVAVGSLVFFKRWSKWYYRSMYKILVRIFPQLEERIGPHRRHVHINQRRRR
ncbi:receptor-like protein 35 [Malus sylvestris]|uniref:receptor-like protein 35 n=1 Tax=Malus sylvestris TaxID=3752 RepID=UPI0021AC703E|nr:receptor-like protein 35 [Malus sylvestris]